MQEGRGDQDTGLTILVEVDDLFPYQGVGCRGHGRQNSSDLSGAGRASAIASAKVPPRRVDIICKELSGNTSGQRVAACAGTAERNCTPVSKPTPR